MYNVLCEVHNEAILFDCMASWLSAVIPFAIPSIWNSINSVTNCGFGYYLFTTVVALIGVVVFSIVVRSYKYRQRDERPFDTCFAEQYYENYTDTSHTSVTEVGSYSDRHSQTLP